MSPVRSFGLAAVAIWFAFAFYIAATDATALLDPHTTRTLCQDDLHPGLLLRLDARNCTGRVLTRGALDALLVVVPTMAGWAIVSRRGR